MRLLSNLKVKGKPAVLPDRAIRRQSHYFIYRPRISQPSTKLRRPHLFNHHTIISQQYNRYNTSSCCFFRRLSLFLF